VTPMTTPLDIRDNQPVSKDVEWARNLAEQMKDGSGRHNSRRVFSQGRNFTEEILTSLITALHVGSDREVYPDFQCCPIGGLVPWQREDGICHFLKAPSLRPVEVWTECESECRELGPIEVMTFQQVWMNFHDGQVYHRRRFWKRLD
jgi:hypothetical protein